MQGMVTITILKCQLGNAFNFLIHEASPTLIVRGQLALNFPNSLCV